jgi:PIN domain nuclease of toxin-antitoxin system
VSRILLDTHLFLWMHTDPARLGSLRTMIEHESTELFLSPASSWEIAIKWGLGKLALPEAPETYVPSRMLAAQVQSLAITHTHTLAVAGLPDHHRDPFGRLLIAQSRTESIPLATVDPLIGLYDVELLTPLLE